MDRAGKGEGQLSGRAQSPLSALALTRTHMNTLISLARWVRPNVDVANTTISLDAGFGLFWRGEPLPRGSFLGVYRGRWRRVSGEGTYRGADRYVMEADGWRVTPLARIGSSPDYAEHPIAAAQEPPPDRAANCVFIPFYKASDIGLAGGSCSIVCVALYTCAVVHSNEGGCHFLPSPCPPLCMQVHLGCYSDCC